MTATSGTGLIYHVFEHYAPIKKGSLAERNNGVLIANGPGKALAYALFNLQERGRLFIGHGEEVYEGMVIGIHSRDNDLVVNPLKAKQLTNIRARVRMRTSSSSPHPAHAGTGAGIHQRRRTGRGDAQSHPCAQALPEGTRAQALLAQRWLGVGSLMRQEAKA